MPKPINRDSDHFSRVSRHSRVSGNQIPAFAGMTRKMVAVPLSKKGVVLLIVLGTVLVVTFLAVAILTVISSHSRLTNHQVSRIKAYYTGKGMMNYVLEKMRTDSAWQPGAANKYACYRGCIDSGVTATVGLDMPAVDADLPYKVQVTIYPTTANGKIDIKTDYTYTP